MNFGRPRIPAPLFLGLLVAVGGCGGPGTGDVTGVVRYQGKLVRSGTVTVFDAAGAPHPCHIRPDGSYTVAGVPVGAAQFAVQSPEPARPVHPRITAILAAKKAGNKGPDTHEINPGVEHAEPPPRHRDWFALPTSAGTPATSGLVTALTPGPNTFDIDLK